MSDEIKENSEQTKAQDQEPKENKDPEDSGNGIAIGLCIGTALGVCFGVVTDNITLWLPIGIAIGLGLGTAIGSGDKIKYVSDNKKQNKTEDDAADNTEE